MYNNQTCYDTLMFLLKNKYSDNSTYHCSRKIRPNTKSVNEAETSKTICSLILLLHYPVRSHFTRVRTQKLPCSPIFNTVPSYNITLFN